MEREQEQLVRMNARAWRRVTVKGLGQDRSLIRRKSVGDVSCLLSPKQSHSLSRPCPDRSPLAFNWMLSCFQSPHFLSRPPPRSICPPVSFVWSSPASTRFPFSPRQHPVFFRRSPFHIACGRFLDQFCSCVLHHHSGPPQSLPCTRMVRILAHAISCIMPHPLPDLL